MLEAEVVFSMMGTDGQITLWAQDKKYEPKPKIDQLLD